MHTGNLGGGHYYSYIHVEGDKWLEFNDTIIREFESNNIASECFGGADKKEGDEDFNQFNNEKDKSAYILFYER